jgi:hypothetical protein
MGNEVSDAGTQTPFDIVCDMEDDTEALVDYGKIIARVAATLREDDEMLIAQLGWHVTNLAVAVRHRRGLLFHALHPNRAQLDAEAKEQPR